MRFSVYSGLAILVLATASVVDAALVSFTQPVDSDASYAAGGELIIRWTFDTASTTPNANTVTGVLHLGKSNSKDLVEIVADITNLDNAALQSGTYTWAIPSTLATSSQYSLSIEAAGTSYYTGKFTIQNSAIPATTNTTNTTNSTAAIQKSTIFLSTVPVVLAAAVNQPFV